MRSSHLRPYAQVLLRTAGSLEQARELRRELGIVAQAMVQVPRLSSMAANPSIPVDAKERVLEGVAKSLDLSPNTARFLRLLLAHFRLHQLAEVLEALDLLMDKEGGIVRAQVQAAQPVDASQRDRLQKVLERVTGGKVDLSIQVNDALLAGFVARIGSQLYDASLKGQLERLASRLASA